MRTLQEEGKRLKEVAENEMVRRFEMSSELQAMQRQLQSAVPSARRWSMCGASGARVKVSNWGAL